MKPSWMAVILLAAFLAGIGISGLLAGSTAAAAVLAGGIVPLVISGTSLAVFFSRGFADMVHRMYQRFVVLNFIIKVLCIGVWTAVILLTTSLPITLFVVSLLINFFLWHLYEAYRYQLALKQGVTEPREV